MLNRKTRETSQTRSPRGALRLPIALLAAVRMGLLSRGRGFVRAILPVASGTLLSCTLFSPTMPGPEWIAQDYYFFGSRVQIQGEADLPPIRFVDKQAAGGATVKFLSLRERRKLCRDAALVHGHTKWLSLTRRDRQVQGEWDLRLSMGGSGRWRECLSSALVRNHFYDEPGRCRVVIVYPCLPQKF